MAKKDNQNVEKYIQEWQRSHDFVYGFVRDLKDLDTIANAQYDRGTRNKPNVGDTTTAGTIRQMMRQAIKELPVVDMSINGTKKTLYAILSNEIVRDRILNPNTFSKGFINTLRLGGRGSLARGFNVFQVSTTKMYGEFGVIPRLVHFNDVGIEPGIQDANLSSYWFVKTQYTPAKMKSIYNREKKKKESTWNIKGLKALIDAGPNGSGTGEYSEFIIDSQYNVGNIENPTFDVITRYSADPKEDIVTFSPNCNVELRRVTNRSKFGYPRVLLMVIDEAELSPLGDSRVRLASPNQNMMMALRQNVATTWLYNSDPALLQKGLFMGPTSLRAGKINKANDPNADLKPILLDNTTAQQYSNISQEIKGQILDMLGYNPNRSLGAIGESKTGVGAQTQRMNIDDASREITNIVEGFVKQYVLSAFDLYLSEQTVDIPLEAQQDPELAQQYRAQADDIIYVSDEAREEILRINPDAFDDPENPNAIGVNWNDFYDYIKKIDATVSVTMSKDDFTNEKRADLQDAVTVMSQTADPNDPNSMSKVQAVQDKLLDTIDPNLLPNDTPQMAQPPVMPPNFVDQ